MDANIPLTPPPPRPLACTVRSRHCHTQAFLLVDLRQGVAMKRIPWSLISAGFEPNFLPWTTFLTSPTRVDLAAGRATAALAVYRTTILGALRCEQRSNPTVSYSEWYGKIQRGTTKTRVKGLSGENPGAYSVHIKILKRATYGGGEDFRAHALVYCNLRGTVELA